MLIEAARRAEAAAKEMLAVVNEGSASCTEVREALEISRAFMAAGSAFQVGAARIIAGREQHGDGGAQTLADAAGLSRRDARTTVNTARVIEAAPAVQRAVDDGRVSRDNAKQLADAISKTSAAAVESDSGLLAKAQSMRPEQFISEARRWTASRQSDGGEADYERLRAKRRVRVWDADDGMMHLHGEFDPATGNRIAKRLRTEARRLHDTDKAQAAENSHTQRRSFDQCMADALDNLTAGGAASGSGGGKPYADICVVAHVDGATGELIAELPDGQRLPTTVLEQLSCNAKLTGIVYDRRGKPIWRTQSRRTVTEAQWQLLIAKWGGCFHCGANPAMCQGHHIEAASQGGPTKLDNLVPACWSCHHRIHHDNWQIHKYPDGHHTLHPPDRIHYGPARSPDHPSPLFEPSNQPEPAARAPAQPDAAAETPPRPGPHTARAALQRAKAARNQPGAPSPPDSTDREKPRRASEKPLFASSDHGRASDDRHGPRGAGEQPLFTSGLPDPDPCP